MNRILRKPMTFLFCAVCIISYAQAQNYPLSDPTNAQNWILNEYMSDEFNLDTLDKTKWWVLGENGDYRSKWKGRAPGQFAPHNVKVEGGELVLSSQWEPSFTFANEKHDGTFYGGSTTAADKSKPITQACIMSERFFKYGYMEIRCKLANAPVTGGFWTTGYHSEIDMIENFGKRPIGNPKGTPEDLEKKYRVNIINWDPDAPNNYPEWKYEKVLNVRVADDYNVYGFEWDKDYVKLFFNGALVKQMNRTELEANDQWRLYYPQELWLDDEVFSWYGLPSAADLTSADFKIDYVRIWQKEISNPNFNALGFEGPFYYQGRSVNWYSPEPALWRIEKEKAASGDLSLRFKNTSPLSGTYSYTIYAPFGSLNLPQGSNEIKMKVFIDPSSTVNSLNVVLRDPWLTFSIDLTGVTKGVWTEVSKTFTRNAASNLSIENGDRLEIQLKNTNVTGSNVLMYIDDISFQHTVVTGFEDFESDTEHTIYPNPTSGIVHLSKESVWEVYSIRGARLLHGKGSSIDLSNQENGMYLLKVGNKTLRVNKL